MRAFVIANSTLALGALAQYTSEIQGVSVTTLGDNDAIVLAGYVASDQNGSLEIWQSMAAADLAVAVPGDGVLVITIPYVAAAGGMEVDEMVSAPYVRVVYTNGAIQQNTFRLILRAIL